MLRQTSFRTEDMPEFEPDAKIGLIATVNPDGLPHITLITALQAKTPNSMYWGQFSEGMSKKHVKNNPKTGFLIMTLNKELWRGKAVWTGEAKEGPDYEMFNRKPMFRYNAYFGIHTVHYMDLVETYGREKLPMGDIITGALLTGLFKSGAKRGGGRILSRWAEGLFNRMDALKFLAYIGGDGFPVLIPVIQCQAADSARLAFSPSAYREELSMVPAGSKVAVFGITFDMEDVLVRGTYNGISRHRGGRLGTIDIDWVYNPMPPKQGQVYPTVELRPVTDF